MPSSSTMGMEDEDEDIVFDSPEDEIAHYREKYRQAMDMLSETRAELEEFQQSSRELEDEMEQELAANEKQQDELKERIKRLDAEKEEWKAKQIALQKMHSSTTAAMQREMDNLRSERDKTLVALRDLEMGNDELERNERVAVSSLLDLESKYNRAIEEKTLLEQEVVQRQELEEECQRLKDDMRDANNEISILRDQLARQTLPTPPSSVSEAAQMSSVQEASQEISTVEEDEVDPASIPLPPPVKYRISASDTPQSPSRRGLPRSATSSGLPISASSPVPRRFQSSVPQSPTLSSLSRSTTSRNLAAAAGPQSPALSRSRSGIPQSSPARLPAPSLPLQSHQQTKSRGFKLLHDLQARLKATDDKLGVAKVPRRNVSNPLSFGGGKRTASATSNKSAASGSANVADIKEKDKDKDGKASHARVAALAGNGHGGNGTPQQFNMTISSSNLMSPSGWVLIDGEDEPTPIANGHTSGQSGTRFLPEEPQSPLDPTFGITRAVSSAASNSSQRSLPSRPGIPSPLANVNALNQSTKFNRATAANGSGLSRSSTGTKLASIRPPSRTASTALSKSTKRDSQQQDGTAQPLSPARSSARTARPASSANTSGARPMSPSMIPTSSRPMSPGMMMASAMTVGTGTGTGISSSSRPMSPSMLPTYRSMRAPSPVVAFPTTNPSCHSSSSSVPSRPLSRADNNTNITNRRVSGIGKGPPPSSHRQSTLPSLSNSTTINSSQGQSQSHSQLRRSTRRSSVGANEHTKPTGIPAPREGGARTPGRPTSVHVFGDHTPPPVPRIPSALLKGDKERKR
ncbi:hypothetical protein I317_01551 [Kwoniella heveanensis CBS 569]|nr:hypothetical protein I317_01551 [Kwoniella heveanensis CBS 569]